MRPKTDRPLFFEIGKETPLSPSQKMVSSSKKRMSATEWKRNHPKPAPRNTLEEHKKRIMAQRQEKAATIVQRHVRGHRARKQYEVKRLAKQEQAHKEARERREEEERVERQARRAAHQRKIQASQQQEDDLMREIKALEEELKQTDKASKEARRSAVRRAAHAKEDVETLQEKIEAQLNDKSKLQETRIKVAQYTKKLEGQAKVISFLKGENNKLRKYHEKLVDKIDETRGLKDKMYQSNSELRWNFDELEEDVNHLKDTNNTLLQDDYERARALNKDLVMQVDAQQEKYMTEAEARLVLQKTMSRILNKIQADCRSGQVVEDAIMMALECEAEAKAIMAGIMVEVGDEDLEPEPDMTQSEVSDSDISMTL
jgi:chromosome segregation ATPase